MKYSLPRFEEFAANPEEKIKKLKEELKNETDPVQRIDKETDIKFYEDLISQNLEIRLPNITFTGKMEFQGTKTKMILKNGEDVFTTQSGAASANGYGSVDLDTAGNWTYTLDNANATVQALSGGETLADSFTAVSADGTTQVVDITITGADDAPSIGGDTSGAVTEDGTLVDTGALSITDTDDGEDVFVYRLEGSKGRGVLTAETITIDEYTERVTWGILRLESGETYDLFPGQGDRPPGG